VGSEVVKQLSLAGQRVRAAVHSAIHASSHEKLRGVELVEIDYNKPETLAAAFKDVDKLFLLTPGSPRQVQFASDLVNEAKITGVRYIVKQSVIGAEKEPANTPLSLHRQAEKIIEESGIPFTFLRPNDFMQNFRILKWLRYSPMQLVRKLIM
jgi:uncharacterized protein YbjT (DUF2867 family)